MQSDNLQAVENDKKAHNLSDDNHEGSIASNTTNKAGFEMVPLEESGEQWSFHNADAIADNYLDTNIVRQSIIDNNADASPGAYEYYSLLWSTITSTYYYF